MLENRKASILKLRSKNIIAKGLSLEESTKMTIDKMIRKWVERIQDVMFYPGRPRYKVEFQEFPESHLVLCDLEIRQKFRKWNATAVDPTVSGALSKAIDDLRMSTTEVEATDVVYFDTSLDKADEGSETATA